MRLSQAPGEAAEFLELFGELLKGIHPDYRRNNLVKGVRAEYCREIAPGLYASHNAYCKKGRYHHGFCLTLHRELPTPYLLSPFTVGGRFDQNHAVNMAFQRDLQRHIILSDSHEYRQGCDRIIQRCTLEAETQLLPHYRSVYEASRTALLALAEMINGNTPIPSTEYNTHGVGRQISNPDCDMPRFRQLYHEAGPDRRPMLLNILASKPELFQRLRQKRAINPAALRQ